MVRKKAKKAERELTHKELQGVVGGVRRKAKKKATKKKATKRFTR